MAPVAPAGWLIPQLTPQLAKRNSSPLD